MKAVTGGSSLVFLNGSVQRLYRTIQGRWVKVIHKKEGGIRLEVLLTNRPHAYVSRRTNPQYRDQWMREQLTRSH